MTDRLLKQSEAAHFFGESARTFRKRHLRPTMVPAADGSGLVPRWRLSDLEAYVAKANPVTVPPRLGRSTRAVA